MAISGPAGTGKTLIAAEKACRIAKAGFNVIILCANPFLAEQIKSICALTNLEVTPFQDWIDRILGKTVPEDSDISWYLYSEPNEEDLNLAYNHIVNDEEKYDAIIVDEAQDFKEE